VPYHRIQDTGRLQALVGAVLLIAEDLELPTVLRTIVQTAVDTVEARYGALGVLDETGSGLAEFVHVGMSPEQVAAIGRLPEGRGMLGLLIKQPEPLRLADISEHPQRSGFPPGHPPMSSFLGVPVMVNGHPYGNLYLTEKRGGPFTDEDEATVSSLALAAGLAIDKARLHARARQLTLSEERERIARDLHDTTIRRLFGVGLSLQAARRILGQPGAGQRLQAAIDELDDTIRQIRSTVFAMARSSRRLDSGSVRGEVLHVVEELTGGRGLDVRVDFDGPIDDAVGRHAAEHLIMSLRQVADGAVHRPGVRAVEVDVRVDDDGLELEVVDDAPAPVPPVDAGLAERARLLGGDAGAETVDGGGMRLWWRVARLQ